jgi:regulator of replication initiation timing
MRSKKKTVESLQGEVNRYEVENHRLRMEIERLRAHIENDYRDYIKIRELFFRHISSSVN